MEAKPTSRHIAIFASGTGSNARKIVEYFRGHPTVTVGLVVSNRPDAAVLAMAKDHGIPTLVVNRAEFYAETSILAELKAHHIDFVVLAGFLWLVPPALVQAYAGCIVNIHPALLPAHGGKGMYGMHVHRAVHAAGEAETGITIHYVNTQYDQGDIIFQARCPVDAHDTPESIAQRVLSLEHRHFAPVLEQLLQPA